MATLAKDVNSITVSGRLGKNPEVRQLPNGETLVTFSLACTSFIKDESVLFTSLDTLSIRSTS